jgi:hypothetical protein
LSATVKRSGREVVVSLVNRAERPICGGKVYLPGSGIATLGRAAACASAEFRARVRSGGWQDLFSEGPGDWFIANDPFSGRREMAYLAQGCLPRTHGMAAYLDRGAAVVCVEYDRDDAPFTVTGCHSSTHHIQLVRLVVFPHGEP